MTNTDQLGELAFEAREAVLDVACGVAAELSRALMAGGALRSQLACNLAIGRR